MKYFVTVEGQEHEVELNERLGELQVRYDGRAVEVRYEEVDRLGQAALYLRHADEGAGGAAAEPDGERAYAVSIEGGASEAQVSVAGHVYRVSIEDERERAAHGADRESTRSGGEVKSVMPGVVVKLCVQEGQVVTQDQPLLILEAMKMQNEILSPSEGKVAALHVREGQAVASGARLVTLRAPEAPASADE